MRNIVFDIPKGLVLIEDDLGIKIVGVVSHPSSCAVGKSKK